MAPLFVHYNNSGDDEKQLTFASLFSDSSMLPESVKSSVKYVLKDDDDSYGSSSYSGSGSVSLLGSSVTSSSDADADSIIEDLCFWNSPPDYKDRDEEEDKRRQRRSAALKAVQDAYTSYTKRISAIRTKYEGGHLYLEPTKAMRDTVLYVIHDLLFRCEDFQQRVEYLEKSGYAALHQAFFESESEMQRFWRYDPQNPKQPFYDQVAMGHSWNTLVDLVHEARRDPVRPAAIQ